MILQWSEDSSLKSPGREQYFCLGAPIKCLCHCFGFNPILTGSQMTPVAISKNQDHKPDTETWFKSSLEVWEPRQAGNIGKQRDVECDWRHVSMGLCLGVALGHTYKEMGWEEPQSRWFQITSYYKNFNYFCLSKRETPKFPPRSHSK